MFCNNRYLLSFCIQSIYVWTNIQLYIVNFNNDCFVSLLVWGSKWITCVTKILNNLDIHELLKFLLTFYTMTNNSIICSLDTFFQWQYCNIRPMVGVKLGRERQGRSGRHRKKCQTACNIWKQKRGNDHSSWSFVDAM